MYVCMLGVDHREMCLFELKKGVALDRLQQDSWPSPLTQSFACLDLDPGQRIQPCPLPDLAP